MSVRSDTGVADDGARFPRSSGEHYRVGVIAYFVALHAIAIIGVALQPTLIDWLIFAILYLTRVIGLTLGYHRLLAHKSFEVPRPLQFGLVLIGAMALQRGPFWWVHHHRLHHRVADTSADPHTPRKGWFYAHMGWIISTEYSHVPPNAVPDLRKQRELVILERLYVVPVLGVLLGIWVATGRPSAVLFGFGASTVVLHHVFFASNSLAHSANCRRTNSNDDSRNSRILGLLLCGDGWHAAHHAQPNAAQHWTRRLDLNFAIIRGLERAGLATNVRARR